MRDIVVCATLINFSLRYVWYISLLYCLCCAAILGEFMGMILQHCFGFFICMFT